MVEAVAEGALGVGGRMRRRVRMVRRGDVVVHRCGVVVIVVWDRCGVVQRRTAMMHNRIRMRRAVVERFMLERVMVIVVRGVGGVEYGLKGH